MSIPGRPAPCCGLATGTGATGAASTGTGATLVAPPSRPEGTAPSSLAGGARAPADAVAPSRLAPAAVAMSPPVLLLAVALAASKAASATPPASWWSCMRMRSISAWTSAWLTVNVRRLCETSSCASSRSKASKSCNSASMRCILPSHEWPLAVAAPNAASRPSTSDRSAARVVPPCGAESVGAGWRRCCPPPTGAAKARNPAASTANPGMVDRRQAAATAAGDTPLRAATLRWTRR
mmetsp:Transcript_4944/g.14464  ORF Transcript_4944/g.14464 Transcript_4944/m.14464 type:complete len:237 (+) Transcript_4944:424-1134(+)